MEGSADTTRSELRRRDWVMQENDQRSLGELLSELTTDLSTLLRQEIELARVETMEKISSATRSVITIVAGGLLAYTGLIGLVIAAIVGLGAIVPLWLSALIIGALLIIVGVILIQGALRALQQMSVVPEKTVESVREDAEMVKEKVTT